MNDNWSEIRVVKTDERLMSDLLSFYSANNLHPLCTLLGILNVWVGGACHPSALSSFFKRRGLLLVD